MKWLTKLKLINWHYFNEEEIHFGPQTMITGRNAAGKSTIIDAMQVLFIANLKTIKFNSSAHDDAKRSLISYLRGKIGSDEKRYVREGDFSTYIMAEFFDEKKVNYFVVGVVIDVYRDDTIDQEYFIINNCQLDNIEYIKETGQLKNRDEFHRYVNSLKNRSVLERSKDGYQKAFLNRMGQVNHRFFSTFTKALSFKPIQNVRDFVYDYILDEQELQLDIMKENFDVHQKYERELEDLENRKNKLVRISEEYSQYKRLMDIVEQQEYVIRQLKCDQQQFVNEQIKNNLGKINEEITQLKHEKKLAVQQHEEAKNKTQSTYLEWQNNQDKKREEQLRTDIIKTENEIIEHKSNLSNVINELNQERNRLLELINVSENDYWVWEKSDYDGLKQGITTIGTIIKTLELSNNNPTQEITEGFNHIGTMLSNLHNQFVISQNNVEQKLKELEERKGQIENEIKNLENKKITYPAPINKLKSLLESELSGKSQVWIFCEEMEVINEEWRNAIEGYLHTQKFDILVEPDFFEQALSIYEREKWKYQLEGVGLVNTFKERVYLGTARRGSLADELETNNPIIQARIEHILGKVIKVSSEKELSQHRASITSSCMLYQNLVARQIKKERYETPYIGAKAIPRQLEIKQNELKNIIQELSYLNKLDVFFSSWKQLLNEKRSFYIGLSNQFNLPVTICKLEEELEQLKIEFKQIDHEGIKKLEQNYYYWQSREKELGQLINGLVEKISSLNERYRNIESEIKMNINKLTELEQEVTAWKNEHSVEMLNMAIDKYKEAEKQDLPLERKIENMEDRQKRNSNKALKKLKVIKNYRQEYNFNHFFNGDAEAENNDEYEMLLEQIDIDIESYQVKLKEALEQSEEEFKSHFIYKMKEAIEGAKRQFRQLNDALKRFPFHEESYQFEYTPSEKYKRFYDIIMDPQIIEKGSLFDIPDDERDQNLHELFEILIKGEAGEQEEFSDYRRYLDFDIIITNSNSRIRFSQVLKEKSGGETQTPFYIAILSSFNQLYSSDKTMRLVVFDEAFNKMDEERIQTSLRLIKNMNFQLIAAVPDEKLSNMAREVSTIIVVQREGYNCFTDMIDREVINSEGVDKGRESRAVQEQTTLFTSE